MNANHHAAPDQLAATLANLVQFYRANFPEELPHIKARLVAQRLGQNEATTTAAAAEEPSFWGMLMDRGGQVVGNAIEVFGNYKLQEYQDRRAQEAADRAYEQQLVDAERRLAADRTRAQELSQRVELERQQVEIERLSASKKWQAFIVPGAVVGGGLLLWLLFFRRGRRQ